MKALTLEKLVFAHPSGADVAWEDVNEDDWRLACSYRGDDNALCDMSLEEQFMFLCFIVQASNRPVLF